MKSRRRKARRIHPHRSDLGELILEAVRDSLKSPTTELLPYGTVVSLDALTSSEQMHLEEDQAVFQVAGAAHTGYLRTGTGDVYENGEWKQLDPLELSIVANSEFNDAAAAMLVEDAGKQEKNLAPKRYGSDILVSDLVSQGEAIIERIAITAGWRIQGFRSRCDSDVASTRTDKR